MSWPPWGRGRLWIEMLKMGQLGEEFIQTARHVWTDALIKLNAKKLQLTKVVQLPKCPADNFFKVTPEILKIRCHMFKLLIPHSTQWQCIQSSNVTNECKHLQALPDLENGQAFLLYS